MSVLYASHNGKRVFIDDTDSDSAYNCFVCGEVMIPKRGDILTHHWAHKSKSKCLGGVTESMTQWHMDMQLLLEKAGCRLEVPYAFQREHVWGSRRLEKGDLNIADCVTPSGRVIEIQHSPISKKKIAQRLHNYGEKLTWVFDGNGGRINFLWRLKDTNLYRAEPVEYYSLLRPTGRVYVHTHGRMWRREMINGMLFLRRVKFYSVRSRMERYGKKEKILTDSEDRINCTTCTSFTANLEGECGKCILKRERREKEIELQKQAEELRLRQIEEEEEARKEYEKRHPKCASCPKRLDEKWMTRCKRCYRDHKEKEALANGEGTRCDRCQCPTNTTWKTLCSPCYISRKKELSKTWCIVKGAAW